MRPARARAYGGVGARAYGGVMHELDEDHPRREAGRRTGDGYGSGRAGLRLAVLAVCGAVVVALMIALVGPGLRG